MTTWSPSSKNAATFSNAAKSAAPSWSYEGEAGSAWAYDQGGGFLYDQPIATYESVKPATVWSHANKS